MRPVAAFFDDTHYRMLGVNQSLVTAAKNGDVELCRHLIEDLGARAGAVDYDGSNTFPIVLKLAVDEDGNNALHLIVAAEELSLTELLVKYSADIFARNKYGRTPLDLAAERENIDLVVALIRRDIKIFQHVIKEEIFHDRKRLEIYIMAAALASAPGDIDWNELLLTAAALKNERATHLLLIVGAKANEARDFEGKTPLILASSERNFFSQYTKDQNRSADTAAIALLKIGPDVDAIDHEGKTALMYAARNGENPYAALHLIKAGAKLDLADSEGNTALHYAARNPNQILAYFLLLAAGADHDLRNEEGESHSIAKSAKLRSLSISLFEFMAPLLSLRLLLNKLAKARYNGCIEKEDADRAAQLLIELRLEFNPQISSDPENPVDDGLRHTTDDPVEAFAGIIPTTPGAALSVDQRKTLARSVANEVLVPRINRVAWIMRRDAVGLFAAVQKAGDLDAYLCEKEARFTASASTSEEAVCAGAGIKGRKS